jgi:hypothetical protein
MKFNQYDTVRIIKILNVAKAVKSEYNFSAPRVGDVATIVEIYTDPSIGYELECSDQYGITQWLITFSPEELKMDLV